MDRCIEIAELANLIKASWPIIVGFIIRFKITQTLLEKGVYYLTFRFQKPPFPTGEIISQRNFPLK